jgi:hypothetical protein
VQGDAGDLGEQGGGRGKDIRVQVGRGGGDLGVANPKNGQSPWRHGLWVIFFLVARAGEQSFDFIYFLIPSLYS